MKRIYIASPSPATADRLRELAEKCGGTYLVCGSAQNTETVLHELLKMQPDILLADTEMAGTDGVPFPVLARSAVPGMGIVTASGLPESPSFRTGDMRQTSSPQELAEALQTAERTAVSAPAGDLESRLYQQIMRHMFYGERTPVQLLEDAQLLQLPLVREFHQILAFHLDVRQPALIPLIAALLRETYPLASYTRYYFSGHQELLMAVGAQTSAQLKDRLRETTEALRFALRNFDITLTGVMGEIVTRLGQIPETVGETLHLLRQIRRLSPGQVININGSLSPTPSALSWNDSFASRCEPQLLHADEADLLPLLQSFLQRLDDDQLSNVLYRYYLLMDILHSAIRIAAADSARDIQETAADFGNIQDMLTAAATRSTFEAMALTILKKAIRLRDDLSPEMRRENVIQRAVYFIQANFGDASLSLQMAAKHVGFSPTHFSTVFSRKMGCTFIEYLTGLRMKKARELLAQTDLKLAQIAMEIGYNDPNYFSHVFKKQVGISPREYRYREADGSRRRNPSAHVPADHSEEPAAGQKP